ncbi:mechanosensitive ion channel [Pedobacter sp. SD-b]|uniref:Mechanosensitive ion channel n=1 Tax=Pedobacter segetis TaxID=2793069 RepID=A0ABS1BK13_9SPHI|nr:mechanosensitive ion channel domain-containing protein [Pedobacter segetis]MBK0383239.1 mechanosensitive ion channel [Pedobacter segetis]
MNTFTNEFTNAINHYWNSFILSLPKLITAVAIIVIGILMSNLISGLIQKRLLKTSKDPLTAKFLTKALKMIFIIFIIMMALYAGGFGGIAAGILAAAGAGAVVLGFAFKDIGENFIAGFILAFNRPFNVDDTIKINDIFGKVKALELRYTKIKTFDGKDVYIPNADVLTLPVYNYTEDGFYRLEFVVGIAYEDDIDGAKREIMEVLNNHPDLISDSEHENFVIEDQLATSTVNLKVLFWADTKDFRKAAMVTKGLVINQVKKDLTEKGYGLPADIQELKIYGGQAGIPIILKDEATIGRVNKSKN